MNDLIKEVEFWSKIYELSFQFWPEQNNVFIAKNGVDIYERGGYPTMQDIMQDTCEYLRRINPKKHREFEFLQINNLNKSGYAGIDRKGTIVDRRLFPDAMPIQKNEIMGIPTPKPIIQ